jgi:nucleoside-diphosphate-sugar epimerase
MHKTQNTVGIIGCGWLGTALAKKLLAKNHQVLATTGHGESAEKLVTQGISANKLILPTVLSVKQFAQHAIFSATQLVICLPPRLKRGQDDYPEKIKQLVAAAEKTGVEHIILISSTAVYNGLSGKVNEQHALDFTADKVQVMHDAEQVLLTFTGQANIIRLSGLIGPERHPGRFLSANKDFANPEGVVNLIHQTDAVGIIEALLLRQSEPALNKAIFNGVSATHPTRERFYQQAAKALDLPQPTFIRATDEPIPLLSKEVEGDKVQRELNYPFVYNDLLTWLTA